MNSAVSLVGTNPDGTTPSPYAVRLAAPLVTPSSSISKRELIETAAFKVLGKGVIQFTLKDAEREKDRTMLEIVPEESSAFLGQAQVSLPKPYSREHLIVKRKGEKVKFTETELRLLLELINYHKTIPSPWAPHLEPYISDDVLVRNFFVLSGMKWLVDPNHKSGDIVFAYPGPNPSSSAKQQQPVYDPSLTKRKKGHKLSAKEMQQYLSKSCEFYSFLASVDAARAESLRAKAEAIKALEAKLPEA